MNPLDVFTNLLKINPRMGRFVAIGAMVLSLAAMVAAFGVAEDVLIRTAVYVLIFSVVVVVLANLQGLPVRVVGWCLTVCFTAWVIVVVVQTVSNNGVSWLAPTQCLVSPISDGCSFAQQSEPVAVVASNAVIETATPPEEVARVYVHFAGAIDRSSVIQLAGSLEEQGWPVAEATRGGERTGKSAGFNEVRYFHDKDHDAAMKLAKATSLESPARVALSVRDLTRTRYSNNGTEGLLEIWISN